MDIQRTITIDYDPSTGITATPSTITAGTGANVDLTWAVGTNVQTINNITVPTAGSQTLPTPTQNGTVWSLQDMLDNTLTYHYTVSILTTSGQTVIQDPQIINDPTDG